MGIGYKGAAVRRCEKGRQGRGFHKREFCTDGIRVCEAPAMNVRAEESGKGME